jgi:hypothetical protein
MQEASEMRSPAIPLLVLLAAVASACSPVTATPPFASPTVLSVSPTPRTATPTAAAGQAGNCYYAWATRDLPTLSQELDRQLQTMDPTISGSAYAFGEDCVAADGSRTFGAMETDFRIRVQVDDVADKDRMGNAIADAMAVVGKLPPSQLQGPQPGRVEFEFVAAGSDSLRLIVEMASYADIAAGLHGAALFDALRPAQ